MVSTCCAVGCVNRADGRKEISFHRIPSDKQRKRLWVRAIKRIDAVTKKLWVPSKYDVLCSEHFREDDFYTSKHRHLKMLKKTAVPSVFSWKPERNSRPVSSRLSAASLESPVEPAASDACASVEVVTVDHSYACDPDTLKQKYQDTLQKLEEVRTKLHHSRRREKRAKVCIDKILQELAEQRKLSEDAQQMLEAYKDIPVELFKRPAHKYSGDQKRFATTMHFHSPKAYGFLREKLHLPHPATLHRFFTRQFVC
ncbi:hypothetical protein GJAV_G00043940 [Gymnothorax javanicus]|nr:hypothetical protein GJAV_G00043940 [Gymnothorax javanicus]